MKYEIRIVQLDKYHLHDPNRLAYYIVNTITGEQSLSYYTDQNVAIEMLQRKNAKSI